MSKRLACCVLCVTIAVTGCGGGAVAVRSDLSRDPGTRYPPGATAPELGPPVATRPAPPPPAAPSSYSRFSTFPGRAGAGFSVSSDYGFGLSIVLTLMLADGIYWVATQLQHAFGEPERRLEAAPEQR